MFVAAEYPSVGVKTLASHMIICIAISINVMNGNAILIYIYTVAIKLCNEPSSIKMEVSFAGEIIEVFKP